MSLVAHSAVQGAPVALSGTSAVTALLAVEGFLLATVSLAASLASPGQKRGRRWLVPPAGIAGIAVAVMFVLALAGTAAWCSVYAGEDLRPVAEAAVGAALIIAIWLQPIIAFLLALGFRLKE